MSFEAQTEYFVSKTDGDNTPASLSVFYAPLKEGFVIPKQVLSVQSAHDIASGSLWRLMTRELPHIHEIGDEVPSLKPSTLDGIKTELDEFMRTNPADELVIDENAPDAVKTALQEVQDRLAEESQTRLANMLGLIIPSGDVEVEDDRPYPGMYL